jgi:dihydrofolate reductase
MRTLSVFENLSLDGYFTDASGDMSWAHNADPEWVAFTSDNARGGHSHTMLFGRVTYEMMAAFWPTPAAAQLMPEVARGMNAARKVVFSRTLPSVSWSNARLAGRELVEEVRALKQEGDQDLLVMGSGSLVAQLTQAGLVDRYQLVVHPLVLGGERGLFEGVVDHRVALELVTSRPFGNGNVVLTYQRPAPR